MQNIDSTILSHYEQIGIVPGQQDFTLIFNGRDPNPIEQENVVTQALLSFCDTSDVRTDSPRMLEAWHEVADFH